MFLRSTEVIQFPARAGVQSEQGCGLVLRGRMPGKPWEKCSECQETRPDRQSLFFHAETLIEKARPRVLPEFDPVADLEFI
jgi:hypothetical protein